MNILTIQHILFPSVDICAEEELFFRRSEKSMFSLDRELIKCEKGQTIQFDTYFNAVSIGKWLKYTSMQRLFLHLNLKGECYVSVNKREHFPHGSVIKPIKQIHIEATSLTEVVLEIEDISGFGLIYFSIKAVGDNLEFHGGYWDAEFDDTQNVKLGIVFCTYKREHYLLSNLERLKDYNVFVVDNAGTLPQNCCEHLYKNRNLGGAGGFARGIYEISKLPEYTHILLMDDDVVIHPESVYRTQTMYSVMKPEYRQHLIGGSMLMLDFPFLQVEAGTTINMDMTIQRLKHGAHLVDPEKCLLNEFEETCDTNAWFFCAFPVALISGNQLPLPVFYQFDDVEFGLRHKGKIIHLNGISVWHESFEAKIFNNRWYYSYRNQLICAAVHAMAPEPRMFIKNILTTLLRELMCFRYKTAELMLDGIEDFLRGVDWLKVLDAENKNLEIAKKCYQWYDPKNFGINICWDELEQSIFFDDRSKFRRVLRLLSLNGFLFKQNKIALVYATNANPFHFHHACGGVYYDMYTHKAFFTQRSRRETLRLLKRYWSIRKVFLKKYKSVCNEYLQRREELTSIEYWGKQFGVC